MTATRSRQFLNDFNSQPHEEADLEPKIPEQKGEYFNSQPHEEADRAIQAHLLISFHFNSQPHEEADDAGGNSILDVDGFQLTASRRG